MLSCEFCEISNNTFFTEHLRATASVKTNRIIKRPINKLFAIENTYHDTDETDKVREQKLRREVAITAELKRKYEC